MTLPNSTSLVDVTHIKQLHLPPIVIPQQQQPATMTDGFMLFCADQTSPSLPVKATSVLYERWNALPNESKRPYRREAIIVNAKLEEDYEPPQPLQPSMTPKQLVPPEAIRSAALEEKEEAALGQQQPFSSYPSFLSMKYRHEQRHTPHNDSPPQDNSSTSPSSSPSSILHHDFTNTSSMTISNLLPPPILEQQQDNNARYLSDEQRKGSITLERLKRPPNAYLLFNRDMRRKLLDLDPKMTVSEISKDIGDRWKYLPLDERQPYIDAAQALKQDHLRNHPGFIYTRRSKAELAEAKRLSKAGRKSSLSKQQQQQQQQLPSPSAVIQGRISLGDHRPIAASTMDAEQQQQQPPTAVAKKRGRQPQPQSQRRDPRGRKKKQDGPKHPMSGFLFFLGAVRPQVAQQFPGSTVGPISKEISARWKKMTPKEREPWLLKAEADKARYAQEMQLYMAANGMKQKQQAQDDQMTASVVQMVNGSSSSSII
ncbi:high mobility group box domain-containing protein [Absidia repens]|uniref:High mobility group box domain-containing protein n=1 Tax=Absidia repens TaxID=90262 RepID=A0A1X2I9T8_9FUNG|nr:high mobility group box domain-containing protein [Absidia repens]